MAEKFQSAPLTEARGDPRFSPNTGRTAWFQSAPLTEARGDGLVLVPRVTLGSQFQSAPLTEARGDPRRILPDSTKEMFQSAPLTEARGDQPGRSTKRRFWPNRFQSAPLTEARGDCRLMPTCRRNSKRVSIRSPHRSEGRYGLAGLTCCLAPCFNPLPSPKRGEISF